MKTKIEKIEEKLTGAKSVIYDRVVMAIIAIIQAVMIFLITKK